MDIQKFETVLVATDSGTITKAAENLGYSQSAISHSIQSLEDEFNVRMLMRGRSGVELTREGEMLLPYIRSVMNSYREFENKVAEINNLECGVIRIGTFTSIAVNWLPRIINSFKQEHPNIRFEILHENYAQIVDSILQGTIDCGFTIPPLTRGIQSILIYEDRLFAIYPNEHPLGTLDNIYPSDLAEYPFILVNEGKNPIIRRFFEERDIKLNVQYHVVDDYATIAMVESNLGISVCPELFFKRLPFQVQHRPINTSFRRKINISYKENYILSPIAKQFITHVKKWSLEHLTSS